MPEPNLQPFHRFAREIGDPRLPFGIRLPAPNQRLAGAVRMQIQVSNVERHQFAAPGQSFIGDAEKCPFAIGSEPFAGTEVSRPIFFSPNRTASLEQGLSKPAAMCARAIAWWKNLPSRLDRASNTRERRGEIDHLVEALWLQAIEEAKIRAHSAAASRAAPSRRDRQALGASKGVAPVNDTAPVIARLEQDLNEFKRLWREERDSRRSANRQADQLRAEVLRLVRG
jgi:hypothetical protein